MSSHQNHHKLTTAGLLVTLGIIYGDIGTSPLYVMKSIVGISLISKDLVFGGISCVFWTLTLQTTFKYVTLTLRADNNGEGGIFSLFTLVRKRAKWLTAIAVIGGAALLADGIITPPISVSSAIEGLRIIYPDIPIIPIVISIITLIFLFQRFGTAVVGKSFGPLMLIWFGMLAILGLGQIIQYPAVLLAINPYYTYNLLINIPEGFWLLGAVFLCTTGAEALYSDLGHCGRQNIRISWILVKICLLLNYFGQGAWLMLHEGSFLKEQNPFYTLMPDWFLLAGIIIATLAAIIASQALITGSFTLVSEAIRLNLWPKVTLNYPSNLKGQLYVPSVNTMLWVGCIGIVLYFRESSNMEAAYGLAITITMLMTTVLLAYYLFINKVSKWLIALMLLLYFAIELSFLVANLVKFRHGGYVTLLVSLLIIFVMWVWLKSNNIKEKLTEYDKIFNYVDDLIELSNDNSVPKYATNLVFLTGANRVDEIETKIMYSILEQQPKRADIYWFIHVEVTDEPYTMEYSLDIIAPDDVVKIIFYLGFRVEQRISLFLRLVVEEMVQKEEINVTSRYSSQNKKNRTGDFRFVVIERFLSNENELAFLDHIVMDTYFFLKSIGSSAEKWFGLDASTVTVEKVPLIISPVSDIKISRVAQKSKKAKKKA